MTRAESQATTESAARRTLFAVLTGAAAFALAYLMASIAHRPVLFYEPIRREFLLGAHAPAPAMGYYGLLLQGLIAGGVASACAMMIVRRQAPSDGLLRIMTYVSGALMACGILWCLCESLR